MTKQKLFLTRLCTLNPEAVIVGSLGNISKDLSEIPHKHKILIKGAMGAAVGCGLGYALSSRKRVIVVVGEGSFLMKLGSMASVLKHHPKNLKIIVLNNGCYASCGGQENYFSSLKKLPTIFKVVKI